LLHHAVGTTRQRFVVGHTGTSQDKWRYAMSELFSMQLAMSLYNTSHFIKYIPVVPCKCAEIEADLSSISYDFIRGN